LVTRTAGDTSLRRKEHRVLANDNRVSPLLDHTPQKHQEAAGKKPRTGSTFKTAVATTKGSVVSMESTYYNVVAPASYGGLSKFKSKRYTKKEVREWLQSQDTYTLHKPTRGRFPRRQVVVYGIDHQWQADLVDLGKLASYNKEFKYLLTCIDVLSRYARVVPFKDKTGKILKEAFQVIFKTGRQPIRLQTDRGTEFTNRMFQKFLKENDVHFITTYNDETKVNFNRTLKTKMWKYFTHRETLTYVDVLQDMVESYNHTVHRTIGIPPAEVTWTNQTTVSKRLYGRKGKTNRAKFLLETECDSAKPSVRSRKDTYLTGQKNCLR
jgi:transposase InsO family protein